MKKGDAPVHELRHYIPVPGKEAAILRRFEAYTFDIFRRMGLKMVDFWVDTSGSGDIWYVMEWPGDVDWDTRWDAYRADPEWIAVKTASEKDGPIVQRTDVVQLVRPVFVKPAYGDG